MSHPSSDTYHWLALWLSLMWLPISKSSCTSNSSTTDQLQNLLTSGGDGYTLSLCAGDTYMLSTTLQFTAVDQEISTAGYPTDETRATLVVAGNNITTAIQATTAGLDRVKLRNVQINGNRAGADIFAASNANIEMGGDNNGQVIEYVHSYDPRGWSCLHIAEGQLKCINATVQNNDIGPCGSDYFQNWADGISLSCQESLVQNNIITDATDGGIVIFGAPFSTIRNNSISVKTRSMLGGINLVDVLPWYPEGNYTHTVVEDNDIQGGFATSFGNASLGPNNESAVIKIGIAIGPEVWFGMTYGANKSRGGTVQGNTFSGAFTFGMAIASAENFVIANNSFQGNVSFIGDYGANCTVGSETPHSPVALLYESSSLNNVSIERGTSSTPSDNYVFQNGTALGLTCFVPPAANVIAWPYGDEQDDSASATTTSPGRETSSTSPISSSNSGASQRSFLRIAWTELVWIGCCTLATFAVTIGIGIAR